MKNLRLSVQASVARYPSTNRRYGVYEMVALTQAFASTDVAEEPPALEQSISIRSLERRMILSEHETAV